MSISTPLLQDNLHIEQITENHPNVKVWTHGVPMVVIQGLFGELHCILRYKDNYRLLRCFWLGTEVAVSVDKEGSADKLLAFLLEKLYKGK